MIIIVSSLHIISVRSLSDNDDHAPARKTGLSTTAVLGGVFISSQILVWLAARTHAGFMFAAIRTPDFSIF